MLRHFQGYLFTLLLTLLPLGQSNATTIEAVGQANIYNNDIDTAREQAVNDAKQQASLQAAAYISSTQQIDDGVLEIDNLRISTLSHISNIEILDEQIYGNRLHVRIRADVKVETACPNGNSGNSFRKTVAIAAFPLETPTHASLGNLRNIESDLSGRLTSQLNKRTGVYALNAGRLLLHDNLNSATTRQLDDGTLTTVLAHTQQLDTQYIISGVIRDMSMLDPSTVSEQNWIKDTYNRLDYKSKKHIRNFAVDVFIHDGFSGVLLDQKSYQTQGRWLFSPTEQPRFATPAFNRSEYGESLTTLINNISADLGDSLRCLPFSARITQTDDNQVWINAGKSSGLSRGDKLTVLRKRTFYNPTGQSSVELINTRLSVMIEDVQPTSARGSLSGSASQQNIQPDDIVMFW